MQSALSRIDWDEERRRANERIGQQAAGLNRMADQRATWQDSSGLVDYSNSEERRIAEGRPIRAFTNRPDSVLYDNPELEVERSDLQPDYIKRANTAGRSEFVPKVDRSNPYGYDAHGDVRAFFLKNRDAMIQKMFGSGVDPDRLTPEQHAHAEKHLKPLYDSYMDQAKRVQEMAVKEREGASSRSLKPSDILADADRWAGDVSTIGFDDLRNPIKDPWVYSLASESRRVYLETGKKMRATPEIFESLKNKAGGDTAKAKELANQLMLDFSLQQEGAIEGPGTQASGLARQDNKRVDGTEKGYGYFGNLQRPDGKVSTELSIGVNIDGKEIQIPLLVPTLSKAETDDLLAGKDPTEIVKKKAADHAIMRMKQGKSPFAGLGESIHTPGGVYPVAEGESGADKQSVLGYDVRKPYDSEISFFKANPNVAGMAAEDGKIVMNPYSKLSPTEKSAVAKNEAVRLWMRENKVAPGFAVTAEQRAKFAGTEYANDENAMRQTIVARILSGDPSAGKITDEQRMFAKAIEKFVKKGSNVPGLPAGNTLLERTARSVAPMAAGLQRMASDPRLSQVGSMMAGDQSGRRYDGGVLTW